MREIVHIQVGAESLAVEFDASNSKAVDDHTSALTRDLVLAGRPVWQPDWR
jgi:hypothetical protein